jgi:thiol:disulfide interchange protein DsbG
MLSAYPFNGADMTFRSFSLLPATLLAAMLLLSACGDAPGTGATAKAGTTPVSTAAIAAEAKGFTAGPAMSARTVYVFFDAQCPHCTALWLAAKPLKSQAKFVWIPVGLLNASSTAQGATLLAAKDPVAAMDEHEASMQAKGGGISAGSDIAAQKEMVEKNTALLTRMGFASIPTIVGTHAQSGALVTQEGAMPTAALAALLGLQVPAGL